jgi:RNA polymerase sigma-70 factor (ECF subfamily)
VDEDQREFAEFYAAAWDDCLRIVTLSVGHRALSEDLVAEAFTKAWASWRKVRGLAEPRAWIIRCALNACVSLWRRHRREVALGSHDRCPPPRRASEASLNARRCRCPSFTRDCL